MIVNIPLNSNHTNKFETQQSQQYEIKEYIGNSLNNMTNITMSSESILNDTFSPAETPLHRSTMLNGTIMSTTMMGQSLKCQANKQVPEIPFIKSVDNNEMDIVPK